MQKKLTVTNSIESRCEKMDPVERYMKKMQREAISSNTGFSQPPALNDVYEYILKRETEKRRIIKKISIYFKVTNFIFYSTLAIFISSGIFFFRKTIHEALSRFVEKDKLFPNLLNPQASPIMYILFGLIVTAFLSILIFYAYSNRSVSVRHRNGASR